MGSRAALKVLVLARSCHSKVLNPYPTMLNRCSPAKRSMDWSKVGWLRTCLVSFSSSSLLCWSLFASTLPSWRSSRSMRCRSCSICLRPCSICAFSASNSRRNSGSAPATAGETPTTPTVRSSRDTPSATPYRPPPCAYLPSLVPPITVLLCSLRGEQFSYRQARKKKRRPRSEKHYGDECRPFLQTNFAGYCFFCGGVSGLRVPAGLVVASGSGEAVLFYFVPQRPLTDIQQTGSFGFVARGLFQRLGNERLLQVFHRWDQRERLGRRG